MKALSITLALVLAAGSAFASGPGETHIGGEGVNYLAGGAMTYSVFEQAVPHVDIANCPAEFDPETVFCRMTLVNDGAHVFVFGLDGDQTLLAVKSYGLEDGFLPF